MTNVTSIISIESSQPLTSISWMKRQQNSVVYQVWWQTLLNKKITALRALAVHGSRPDGSTMTSEPKFSIQRNSLWSIDFQELKIRRIPGHFPRATLRKSFVRVVQISLDIRLMTLLVQVISWREKYLVIHLADARLCYTFPCRFPFELASMTIILNWSSFPRSVSSPTAPYSSTTHR